MKRQASWLRRGERDEKKAELDRQTTYVTLLPGLGEGYQPGYQPSAGIVRDTNQKPHEWLENIAKYMLTPGEEVGYSIPDVLAVEQQMRRLIRLPYEEAMSHQEMTDWRAILAIMLLWDSWEGDETWPRLRCDDFAAASGDAAPFRRGVISALPRHRAAEGLKVYALLSVRDNVPLVRPLCLASRAVILTPAANPGDLSDLLPPHISWYDRKEKRFLDPCNYLDETDRTRLVAQLRLLQYMNESPELGGSLYSESAQLVGVLDKYIGDLLSRRGMWRKRLDGGDPEAEEELRLRVIAVYGLCEMENAPLKDMITVTEERLDAGSLSQNPLILAFTGGKPLPSRVLESLSQKTYCLGGVPFARRSKGYLLEPVGSPEEPEAMNRLSGEVALSDSLDGAWHKALAKRLYELARETGQSAAGSARVAMLLSKWAARQDAYPMMRDRKMTITYPLKEKPELMGRLLMELLGMDGDMTVFSDKLLIITGCAETPFGESELAQACRMDGDMYAVPPISPAMARFLMEESATDDPASAFLAPGSISLKQRKQEDGFTARAAFTVRRRLKAADATVTQEVTFVSYFSYRRDGAGSVTPLTAAHAPYVMCWPNVRLSEGLWKRYYVYTRRPEALDVWIMRGGKWVMGVDRASPSGRGEPRAWQTAVTEQFPSYVVLKRGNISLGALFNALPRTQLKHEPAAVISVDFGSISTTVMMRQGERVFPCAMEHPLHGALLRTRRGEERFLSDELIPLFALVPRLGQPEWRGRECMFYSVMDMFVDDEKKWERALIDGHIYYPESFNALVQKSESTLYYDMKWGEEPYVVSCLKLYLKQVTLQAMLSARLSGSPSASFRVSMPNAMPLAKQAAYLDIMRALAGELSAETGMPLTPDMPSVLFASENQAGGMYFRERNEVSVRNGYINMDIGGGTTDISLWLDEKRYATLETSLLLGCRQILFESLSRRHLSEFEADFEASENEGVREAGRELVSRFSASGISTRRMQKNMFLMDDFFAKYGSEVRAMMRAARANGRISIMESVLLLNFAFLMRLCGEILESACDMEDAKGLLRERMEICIAGNGGQFFKCFDEDEQRKLCDMALDALRTGHPVKRLTIVQSSHPKQEVAIGLLGQEEYLRSAISASSEPGGERIRSGDPQRHLRVFSGFLPSFYRAFPRAGEKLLGAAFDTKGGFSVVFTPSAGKELQTIVDNELRGSLDDYAAYVRCFAAIKRLWKI